MSPLGRPDRPEARGAGSGRRGRAISYALVRSPLRFLKGQALKAPNPITCARKALVVALVASTLLGTDALSPLAPVASAAEAEPVAAEGTGAADGPLTVVPPLEGELDSEGASSEGEPSAEAADAATAVSGDAAADDAPVTLTRSALTPGAGLDAPAYLGSFQIPVASYESSVGERPDWPLSNAFDGNWNTTYMAPGTPQQATITVSFGQVEEFSRILYRHIQLNQQNGFPTHFKLHVSETGEEGTFREVADYQISDSERPTGPVAFSLSEPVRAKSVRFEILASPAGIVAAEFKFLRYDATTTEAGDLFADANQTVLKDRYNSDAFLADLQARVEAHVNKDALLPLVRRAWQVFNGEVRDQNSRVDWPVRVMQKTGPDTERTVWVFMAEGYRGHEQDKFVADLQSRLDALFKTEPYRSLANDINIYAVCVESNMSGITNYKSGPKVDTYFNCVYNKTLWRASECLSPGKIANVNNWLLKNVLDPGASVTQTCLQINSNIYAGAGYGSFCTYTLATGYAMFTHESSHGYAALEDEYDFNSGASGDARGVNSTLNNDPKTIRWREFLGFRGVTIRDPGTGKAYLPANGCLMNSLYVSELCEVCKEIVFRKVNDRLGADKHPLYVARPQVTVKLDDSENPTGYNSGPTVSDANVTTANGKRLELRTVVNNYLDTTQEVTLRFRILAADGTPKLEREQTFAVTPSTQVPADVVPQNSADMRTAGAHSLSIVTDELSGLEKGDVIRGEVVYEGETQATLAKDEWATLNVSYRLVDADGRDLGALPNMQSHTTPVYVGSHRAVEQPEVAGYVYVGSSVDEGSLALEAGGSYDVVRYYKAASSVVTRRLVDVNGLTVSETSARVAFGQVVTPAASDFAAADGYRVVAPAPVTVGEGDVTLTYTLARDGSVRNVARGKAASVHWAADGSAAPTDSGRGAALAVDGVSNNLNNYVGFGTSSRKEGAYLQVDLGGLYSLCGPDGSLAGAVRMWRYWAGGRQYDATVIVASEGGTFGEGDREVIFNSDVTGALGFGAGADALYRETSAGRSFDLSHEVRARAIRVYMTGNGSSGSNHVNELEVYGTRLPDEDVARLEAAVGALQGKLESNRYVAASCVPGKNAVEAARRLLYQGSITKDALAEALAELEAATAKLREKDATAGFVEFLGGSLRYSDDASTRLEGLRLGYRVAVPADAVVDWGRSGWSYGLDPSRIEARFRAMDNHLEQDDGTYVANIVLTNVPAARYDAVLYARPRLVYMLEGREVVLEGDVVNARSVDGVAARIEASDAATARERALAQTVLGA